MCSKSITLPKTIKELKERSRTQRRSARARQARRPGSSRSPKRESSKGRSRPARSRRHAMACSFSPTTQCAPPGRPANIDEGATVRERQKIFSVVDLAGPMQVNTKVHESQIDKLSQKMKARISVDAFSDQTFDGAVVEVAPLPDPTTFANPNVKVYTTRVKIDQPVQGLRPGMTAQVEILVAERDDVLSVPVEAIVQFDNKYHVAVKKPDGVIELREVELGLSNEKFVEVKQGIKSGDLVVTKPLDLLNDKRKGQIGGNPAQPTARPGNPQ